MKMTKVKMLIIAGVIIFITVTFIGIDALKADYFI